MGTLQTKMYKVERAGWTSYFDLFVSPSAKARSVGCIMCCTIMGTSRANGYHFSGRAIWTKEY